MAASVFETTSDDGADLVRLTIAVGAGAMLNIDLKARKTAPELEVCNARDGVRAVGSRSAAGDYFYTIDQTHRNSVEVDGPVWRGGH